MEFLKGGSNLRKGNAEMCASGAEHVTFKDVYPPGGSMSSVRRDAAVGTITLQWILFFLPSIARVLFRPTSPILAALQPKHPDKNTLQHPHTTAITHKHVLSHTTKQCFLPSTGEGSSEPYSKKILKALKVCSRYHPSICKMKWVKPQKYYFHSKTNQMHKCIKFILFWNDTLHVSDGLSVQHQQFKTVHTATGICQTDTAVCLLAGTRWNSSWQADVESWTADDGRKDHP